MISVGVFSVSILFPSRIVCWLINDHLDKHSLTCVWVCVCVFVSVSVFCVCVSDSLCVSVLCLSHVCVCTILTT